MKLLFDENLPVHLVRLLSDFYPESAHVNAFGLGGASDRVIWDHAGADGYVPAASSEEQQPVAGNEDGGRQHTAQQHVEHEHPSDAPVGMRCRVRQR